MDLWINMVKFFDLSMNIPISKIYKNTSTSKKEIMMDYQ